MAKLKRANGTGSIEILPSGKARISVMRYGKRMRQTFDNEEEAREVLAAFNKLQASGEIVHKDETLNSWLDKWLTQREIHGSPSRPVVKDVHKERGHYRRHIVPSSLGRMPLKKIRHKDVEAFALSLRSKQRADGKGTLGAATQKYVMRLVKQSLKAALKEGLIKVNPAADVRVASSGTRKKDDDWLRADEIDRLLSCEKISIRNRTVYACAIGLALRLNDLKNLKVSDVFLDAEVPGPFVRVKIAKTGKDHRVPILPWLEPWLRRHIESLPEGSVYLFPTRTGGPYRSKTFDFGWSRDPSKNSEGALNVAGIDRHIVFHDLRGTCATHLALGTWGRTWSLTEVCQMLAHSDQRMTERYVRRVLDTLSQAAKATPGGPGCPPLPMGAVSVGDHCEKQRSGGYLPKSAQVLEIVRDSDPGMGNAIAHTPIQELARSVLLSLACGRMPEREDIARLATHVLTSEPSNLAPFAVETNSVQ